MDLDRSHSYYDINAELCTFCGTCVGICPNDALISNNEKIYLQGECKSCGLCYKICPGREVNFPALSKYIFNEPNQDIYFGYHQFMYAAHSEDSEIRRNASSGGVVTSLLCYLLEAGHIDGAVVVGSNPEKAWEYAIRIAKTREEIIEASQSKYILVPLNEVLKEIEKCEGNFAIVGLPCHIQGIRKSQIIHLKAACKIKYCIGLYCGFNMHKEATDELINKLGIKNEDITSLQYRGGGHPGGFSLKTQNSEKTLDKSYYNIYNPLYVPDRCLLCTDLTNELADISVGDIWLKRYSGGWSSVITRSTAGHRIFIEALENGYITAERIKREDLVRSHSHLLKHKKKNVKIRLQFNNIRPDYSGALPEPTKKEYFEGAVYFLLFRGLKTRWIHQVVRLLPLNVINSIANCVNKVVRKRSCE